jgi:alkylation response protein AidB-like acyl-CoA dehydrogenase
VRFAFTDEQVAFAAAVRDALARECPPAVVRAAWEGKGWPSGPVAGAWSALVDMGVTDPSLTELDWALVLEEAGRAALPAPLAETAAAGGVAGLGREPLVAWGAEADTLVLVDGGEVHRVAASAVRVTPQPTVDLARPLARVEWAPSPSTRVDADGRRLLDRLVLATSCVLAGLAQRMLDDTVAYASQRHQFGKPIGSFQAVKHHLANAAVRVEFARPVVHAAAWALATRQADASVRASMAKACASDAAVFVSRVALQVHGAIGYSFEHDLHRWMKRAWALAADWGDAAWHRRRVAAHVLDGERE